MTKEKKITNRKKIIYGIIAIVVCLFIAGLLTSNPKGFYYQPTAKKIIEIEGEEIISRGLSFVLAGNGHCDMPWYNPRGYTPSDLAKEDTESICTSTYKKYANVFSIDDGQYIGIGFWKYVIFIDKEKASGKSVSLWKWSGTKRIDDENPNLNLLYKKNKVIN